MSPWNVEKIIDYWRNNPNFLENFISTRCFDVTSGMYTEFPMGLPPLLGSVLNDFGIKKLYTHQISAYEKILSGKNVVISTGTASGKSLCYFLPILQRMIVDPQTCALLLYPTKALAQDQFFKISQIINLLNEKKINNPIFAAIYDGDTPVSSRKAIREQARILISNPDMLHTAILPHHTLWERFLRELEFIVVDEAHIYRGIFGSHLANIFRRLQRISSFYHAKPVYSFTSATIANPVDFCQRLIEQTVECIAENGSPHGQKFIAIYNPPLTNPELGIRKSPYTESIELAEALLSSNVQSIIFSHTRKSVEFLVRGLISQYPSHANEIYSYRSGYLPKDRRMIEEKLRQNQARIVVATNALELGIDIGGVDSVLMIGYPGSIASFWQQAGRAGRKNEASLAILIASTSPLDQYLANHCEYIFERPIENALINPDNLLILLSHLRCALFELNFGEDESFGNAPVELIKGLLALLEESSIVHHANHRYYWIGDSYPADQVSIRSAEPSPIKLKISDNEHTKTIGEVDRLSSYWMVHPSAIYLHQGKSYLVQHLDLEKNEASLTESDGNFYTEPHTDIKIERISENISVPIQGATIFSGEIQVTSQVTGYRRVEWLSNEKSALNPLDMPTSILRTIGFWLTLTPETVLTLKNNNLWTNDPNDYGNQWIAIREFIRRRDNFTCQVCGLKETSTLKHHIHHKLPFRMFSNPNEANNPHNLVTLCPACHQKAETLVKIRSGLNGVRNVIHYMAAMILMCDIGDLGSSSELVPLVSPEDPGVILYDMAPGGVGLSQELTNHTDLLIESACSVVRDCTCLDGCPACVGASGEMGSGGKRETLALLDLIGKRV